MTSQARVLVVGSINEDVILSLPRLPVPGETLAARSVTRRPGGKGANQAVAAARAGADVEMIGRVGDDQAGERMLADLRGAGVGVEAVRVLPSTATGTAYITVARDGENAIVLDAGANAELTAAAVRSHADRFAGADLLLAQLEVPLDAVHAAVATAREAGVRAVLTLAPAREVDRALLTGLDPLLVNEHEAAVALGDHAPGGAEARARALRALGPRSVVITLGSRGVVIADSEGVRAVAAPAVARVLDSTGAGDAFAGALAAALARGTRLDVAVAAGQAAGAAAVGRAGAR